MGDDEARADAPRIGGKPAHPPGVQEVLAVDDGEVEAEFLRQLVLPLQQHRGRRRDDDHLNAAAQEQLSNDETGFHRLAEANIVGDQQIDARQLQRLGQGKKLVGVQPDARPKRRLKQLPIRRRGCPPFGRAQVSTQTLGPFEGLGQQGRPVVRVEDLRLQFSRERELDSLALQNRPRRKRGAASAPTRPFPPVRRSRTFRARKRNRPAREPRLPVPGLNSRSYRSPNEACQGRRKDDLIESAGQPRRVLYAVRQGRLTRVRRGRQKAVVAHGHVVDHALTKRTDGLVGHRARQPN